ncbi:MAG: dTDP-4-dehydrorhamnose 3,5-epimerase [Anaerolineales bacterium]
MPFQFENLDIPGVVLIQAKPFEDERGFFLESYKRSDYIARGIPWDFVQDNSSHSVRGVLRGLHYQLEPKAQGKLVSVIRGEVYDVAVDLRKGSPTYGHWLGARLSAGDHTLLWVPVGFAHGFLVLSEEADVVYKVTEEYAPEAERGIAWNDPTLAIPWPIVPPLLSPKDARLPTLGEAENNFTYPKAAA